MHCSTSSVCLPGVKIHSVFTYISSLLRANGSDPFCEKALKYKYVWITQITSCYLEPLESWAASLFFKLKQLPDLFCIISVLEPGADCPQAVPFMLLKVTAAIYHHEGIARVLHAQSLPPASGQWDPAVGKEGVSGNQKGCLYCTAQH